MMRLIRFVAAALALALVIGCGDSKPTKQDAPPVGGKGAVKGKTPSPPPPPPPPPVGGKH